MAVAVLIIPATASASGDQHGVALEAISGTGSGTVNVTNTPGVPGFSAEITLNVHGTSPNTTFWVQRAPELGRPLGTDGVCQRADGLDPWVGAPRFVQVPLPLTTPFETLTTSAGGAGVDHFFINLPAVADTAVFDVEFRLVNSLTSPTVELRSECFTIHVK
jgi:hypothetical protein